MRTMAGPSVDVRRSMPNLAELPFQAAAKIQQYAERGLAELHYARKMFEAGALKLEPPQNVAQFVADMRRWGEFGMIPALNARRTPNRTAIVDDDGEITFKELDDAAHATCTLHLQPTRGPRAHLPG